MGIMVIPTHLTVKNSTQLTSTSQVDNDAKNDN